MRLIDADTLKNETVVDLANTMRMQEMHKGDMAVRVLDKIDEAPTIDAVPVIRCKDCKHRGGYHCPMYHVETCLDDLDGFDDYSVDRTVGDGFCYRGERRE